MASAPDVAVSVYCPILSIRQPLNDADPVVLLVVRGFAMHESTAPSAVAVMEIVTGTWVATGLPAMSVTVMTGWTAKATPAVAPDGVAVKTSFAATPALIVNEELTAPLTPAALAVNVYVPDFAIKHPAKVATPELVVSGFDAHSMLAPAGVEIDSVTGTEVATVFPLESTTATTGCRVNTVPLTALDGDEVKVNRDGAPGLIVNCALDPEFRPLDTARNV